MHFVWDISSKKLRTFLQAVVNINQLKYLHSVSYIKNVYMFKKFLKRYFIVEGK